jgi:hypothetical protein
MINVYAMYTRYNRYFIVQTIPLIYPPTALQAKVKNNSTKGYLPMKVTRAYKKWMHSLLGLLVKPDDNRNVVYDSSKRS